jgi:tripartite ATP-independent transporter DctM subunit
VAGGLSISKLFLAGIVPGLMMGVVLVFTWWLVNRGQTLAVSQRQPLSKVLSTFKDGIWALAIPVIIVGGIKAGVFTPTEAGVVAAVYSFLVGAFVYKELKVSQLPDLMLAAGKVTAVIMFLVAAAAVSAWLITIADLPQAVISLLEPLIGHKILLMVVIMVIVVVVGTAMDLVPTILILTPVLMPVVKQAGIDPVYFGVLFIMNNAIGLVTPPVGTVLNVICGVSRITMDEVMKGIWPFLLAHLLLLAALTLFPQLVLVPMKWWM